MPAIDSCEPQMIRAFQKANWSIGDQPFAIRLAEKRDHVFADLRLINRSDNAQIVVIEVKCFPDSRSQLDEFYHAVGQYLVYRSALVLDERTLSVYLAIPEVIYNTFFHRATIQITLTNANIKLVVIDLEKEEIVLWQI